MAYFDGGYFDGAYFDTGDAPPPAANVPGGRIDMLGILLGTYQIVESGSGNSTTGNNISGLGSVGANLLCAQAEGKNARFGFGAANATLGVPIIAGNDMQPIAAGQLTAATLANLVLWTNGTLNLAAYKSPRIANEY